MSQGDLLFALFAFAVGYVFRWATARPCPRYSPRYWIKEPGAIISMKNGDKFTVLDGGRSVASEIFKRQAIALDPVDES